MVAFGFSRSVISARDPSSVFFSEECARVWSDSGRVSWFPLALRMYCSVLGLQGVRVFGILQVAGVGAVMDAVVSKTGLQMSGILPSSTSESLSHLAVEFLSFFWFSRWVSVLRVSCTDRNWSLSASPTPNQGITTAICG